VPLIATTQDRVVKAK